MTPTDPKIHDIVSAIDTRLAGLADDLDYIHREVALLHEARAVLTQGDPSPGLGIDPPPASPETPPEYTWRDLSAMGRYLTFPDEGESLWMTLRVCEQIIGKVYHFHRNLDPNDSGPEGAELKDLRHATDLITTVANIWDRG